jgi:hypothetical protein
MQLVGHLVCRQLRQTLHHREQFVTSITVASGKVDQLLHLRHDDALLWRTGDRDRPPASDLQESFIAKHPKRSEHGIRMHFKDRGKVFCLRNPLARLGFAVRNRSPDFGGDLFVEIKASRTIHGSKCKPALVVVGWLDRTHNNKDSSVNDRDPYAEG